MTDASSDTPGLLGAAAVRRIAAEVGIRPTKQWGQNFVVDANTVRRIVRLAGVGADDVVVEVETSKSLVELPIPFAGRVHKLLVSEGDLVDVTAGLATIAEQGTGSERQRRALHDGGMAALLSLYRESLTGAR